MKNLIAYLETEPSSDFIDPISLGVMREPVLLSSGVVIDKESCVESDTGLGKLKFKNCPITR